LPLNFSECGHLQSILILTLFTHYNFTDARRISNGDRFLKVHTLLRMLQVNKNETSFSFENTEKSPGWMRWKSPKRYLFCEREREGIALPKMLCGKEHCHDAKCTCPAKDLEFFDNCISSKT